MAKKKVIALQFSRSLAFSLAGMNHLTWLKNYDRQKCINPEDERTNEREKTLFLDISETRNTFDVY